jgi:hypothetical protein
MGTQSKSESRLCRCHIRGNLRGCQETYMTRCKQLSYSDCAENKTSTQSDFPTCQRKYDAL